MGAARARALLDAHGLRPRRSLGQHFLIEPRALESVLAAAALVPEDWVIEVGPGLGALTWELGRRCRRVTAIEIDPRLARVAREVAGAWPGVEVIEGDALRQDWRAMLRQTGAPAPKLVSNLPYSIATPLLMEWLVGGLPLARAVVMVQREVADRALAAPGVKDYGPLSVAIAYRGRARLVARVSPSAFLPPPRVESAVIIVEVASQPAARSAPDRLFAVVRAAFGQRRKTLRNALAAGLGAAPGDIAAAAEAAGVDPARRGETLSLAEFDELTVELTARGLLR